MGLYNRLRMRPAAERVVVAVALALSVLMLGLQAFVLRPRMWPAGAGLTLSSERFARLAPPAPVSVIRPPDVRDATAGTPVTVHHLAPGGAADRAGVRDGDRALAITLTAPAFDARPGVAFESRQLTLDGLPRSPADALGDWRVMQHATGLLTVAGADGATRNITLDAPPIWSMENPPWGAWLRQHLGPLSQMTAFIIGAAALVGLGARGKTAMLMTLALLATATANSGPLLGAERVVPVIGGLLLVFNWLVTAFSFPIIGLAVLYFPHREIPDRQKWIVPAVIAASIPMFVIGAVSAVFLLGVDAALPALSWLAMHGWTFEASFAVALAANVLIVVEGIARYRTNLDADERRRIQIVVFTGVPAVFAYALKVGLPIVFRLLGMPIELPWVIEAALQMIVLLPAFGLPYAVAVKHVFSPRTVLRRSLQYALARRTLTVLVAVPVIALAASLVQQRDQPLSTIISGRPMFYVFFLAMLGFGLKYREGAQRWLDQRFFRAEYDAREILVSLAGRVPYEADPRDLVAMVVTQIDSALHPECIAVLASDSPHGSNPSGSFEAVSALRVTPAPLAVDSGVVTLLKWSDKPLEVFLDDEQSPVARVPAADRAWLASMRVALLVPIFAGGSDPRPFVGLVALGAKRSEEPYTAEDRELLRGIAVQMGVALDLSRLRKQVGTPGSRQGSGGPAPGDLAPTVVLTGSERTGIGVGAVVDGKYRVDAVVGQGGMGAVYRAWDLRLERDVAIKVVRADLISDPDARMRFRRESQIVAKLQHPSIVTVYDYGTLTDGSAFLVMEYVRGEDLRRYLRREKRLDALRAASLLSGIAGGIEVAHTSGIFHRDLKPENILLPDGGSMPKVVDFGVAKLTSTGVTSDSTMSVKGTIVGTPAYMSPEQLRGEPVDARCDVYSLGVMAYEMLTERLPFAGSSLFDIGMKQMEGRIDTSGLDPAIAAAIVSALAYDKDKRPASALAFAEQIRAAV